MPHVQADLPRGVQPAGERPACDLDGTPLVQRSDDDELTAKRRLALYREQTEPLECFYRDARLLLVVDAEAPMVEVSRRTDEALETVEEGS